MWIFLLADLLSVHRYINRSLGKGSKVSLLVDLRMRMRTSKNKDFISRRFEHEAKLAYGYMITRMVLCCDTGLKRGKLFSLGLLMLIATCCSPIAIGQQGILIKLLYSVTEFTKRDLFDKIEFSSHSSATGIALNGVT